VSVKKLVRLRRRPVFEFSPNDTHSLIVATDPMQFPCGDIAQTDIRAIGERGDSSFGPCERLVGASGIRQKFDDLDIVIGVVRSRALMATSSSTDPVTLARVSMM